MKFILFVCKLGSPIVLAVDCGLLETDIPSGEPTTHRDKDHHGYAMMVHRDKLYRSDQRGVLASQVGRYDVLACGDL